jgi:hypothetical protein
LVCVQSSSQSHNLSVLVHGLKHPRSFAARDFKRMVLP